jgi:hypothetical protein
MMILKYIGYGMSVLFVITSLIFFVTSIYIGLKYTKMLKHTKKSIKLSLRYSLLSIFAFGLVFWLFLTVESGFSWNSSATVAGLILVASFMVLVNAVINNFFVIKENGDD